MVTIKQEVDVFLSSNATNIIAAYVPETIYSTDAEVRVESRIYKSISDANVGNYPPNYPYTKWMDWEASNEYAMLDLYESTVTNFTADGIVVFERGIKDSIAIGNFKASQITIEYLDDLDTVLDTETYNISSLGLRIDAYSYIYAEFDDTTGDIIYKPLQRLGTKIRVTFKRDGGDTYCGFLVAGIATDLGKTLDKVSFSNRDVGSESKREASFSTSVVKTSLMPTLDFGKTYKDIPMLFIIDPSENSSHQNMATIAKITSSKGVGEVMSENTINWVLTQY